MHQALENQNLKCKIPIFPSRKLFGITNEKSGAKILNFRGYWKTKRIALILPQLTTWNTRDIS